MPETKTREQAVEEAKTNDDLTALAIEAKREIARRRARHAHLPAGFFAEGCWNILLDLFIHFEAGKPVSVTDACLASGLPATTALRSITLIEKNDLAMRSRDPADGRRIFLSLTAQGLRSVSATLREVAAHDRLTSAVNASPAGTSERNVALASLALTIFLVAHPLSMVVS